jgi:pilus assembly protein CpaF
MDMNTQSWSGADALRQGGSRSSSPAAAKMLDPEQEWEQKIYQRILQVLDLSLLGNLDEANARVQITEVCQQVIAEEQVPLSRAVRQRVVKRIGDEILGLGPLEPLLADPSVSDILVNGAKSVYVERSGKLVRTDVKFRSDQHLMNIIDRIVTGVGRRIDESSPMVDARLKDGSRVNAIIPPLAIDGPSISIRRFCVDRLDVERMIEYQSLTRPMADLLRGVVESRLNVLISGGTGTGKTTMLNVMSGFIPEDERIITIEDSAELQLQQPHVLRLETRPPNIEGKGEVTQRDLVKNALRMRPERIVLGEIRAGEALDMLQAMNTGHDGSLATVHANTPRDALTRIETMVAMSGVNLPQKPLRQQVAAAIDVVLQLERQEDGRRRVVSIAEVNGMEGEIITMSEIFRFRRRGLDEDRKVVGVFEATGVVPKFFDRFQERGLDIPLSIFSPEL